MKVLITGGGLSGILVSAELRRLGIAHAVAEKKQPYTGTGASSGILNPVMGRKHTLVPHWEVLMPACRNAYTYLETLLSVPLLHPVAIMKAHTSEADAQFWQQRANALPRFLSVDRLPEIQSAWDLTAPHGYGVTHDAYRLDGRLLQEQYLALLAAEGRLIEAEVPETGFPEDSGAGFTFAGQQFTHIIYCNGRGALQHPDWAFLPLSVNKGQALVIDFKKLLPREAILKFGKDLTLCPWGERYWWAGASFEWQAETDGPTTGFRKELVTVIQRSVSVPFKVVELLSGFRVSARDRTAIAGWHPQQKNLGIVTALGTKGVLQAPYAASMVASNLISGKRIDSVFNPVRFWSP